MKIIAGGLVAFLLVSHSSRRRPRRDAGGTATTIAGTITRRGTLGIPGVRSGTVTAIGTIEP